MSPSTSGPANGSTPLPSPPELPLAEGGLLFTLLRWAHLTDEALSHLRRRIVVIVLFAWLPPFLLSALEGNTLGGRVAVPFLLDVEVQIRFLVALPLLLIAEVETHRRMPPLLQQFVARHLIPENSMTRFRAAVASASSMRTSMLAEVLLIAVVYGFGMLFVWRYYRALDVATWYATSSAEGPKLTVAGIWYVGVSVPIAQFLLFRWYWRLLAWARFLWQVSRIDLNLIQAHADRAGGLGFLAATGYAFTMLAVAHGAQESANIANRIFFAGARLPAFADEICVVVIFMLCVILGPLLFFSPQLAATKQVGLRKYGMLDERYVRAFDAKWFGSGAPTDETLVGSADIQSLADLSNSYEVVRTMRISPITTQSVVRIAAATLIPILPLQLTMIPLNEWLKRLSGVIF